MKAFFAFLLSLLMLAGCATSKEKEAAAEAAKARQDRTDAIVEGMIATAKVPLLKMKCPPAGCNFTELEVGNPNAVVVMADAMKEANRPAPVQMSEPGQIIMAGLGFGRDIATGAFIARGVGRVVDGFTNIAASGNEANKFIAGSGFSANGVIASNIPQPGAINTVNVSGAGAAASVGGNASGSQSTVTNTNKTINGPGIIDGSGSITTPVCTVNPTTGVKTCT